MARFPWKNKAVKINKTAVIVSVLCYVATIFALFKHDLSGAGICAIVLCYWLTQIVKKPDDDDDYDGFDF